LLSRKRFRLCEGRRCANIGHNRKAYREREKKKKWKQQDNHGIPGKKNEFGITDLTPHNAARVINGGIAIKY